MSTFDQIVEGTCVSAGGDFAFLLTRRGRLVTQRAPQEMSDVGRSRILLAAQSCGGVDGVVHLEMPRNDLVPFGGAAPVDVYVGVAADQAILCLVMATWAEKRLVAQAMALALRELEAFIQQPRGPDSARAAARFLSAPPPPSAGPAPRASEPPPSGALRRSTAPGPPSARPSSLPPPATPRSRGAMAGLSGLVASAATRARLPSALPPPPAAAPLREEGRPEPSSSRPEIRIGETTLGRESLEAIERERCVRSSMPDVAIAEATIGPVTLAAIQADLAHRLPESSAPDSIRLELASVSPESRREIVRQEVRLALESPRVSQPLIVASRLTQPWIESAADAKRATEAASAARRAPPQPEPGVAALDPADTTADPSEDEDGPAGKR